MYRLVRPSKTQPSRAGRHPTVIYPITQHRHRLSLYMSHRPGRPQKVKVAPRKQTPYGPIWFHMVPYGLRWAQVVPYGPRWVQMVPDGPIWSHMVPFGSRWAQMAPDGSIWLYMVPYGPIWSHMAPHSHRIATSVEPPPLHLPPWP